MTPPARPGTRRARAAGWLAGIAVAAVALAGCANADAQAQAQKACTHVTKALALYAEAQRLPPAQAAAKVAASMAELRAALPIAAVAAGQSAHWQPLMMTLQQSSSNQEGNLVRALSAQCADADNAGI
jgi:hypothetical protein